jgi:hypothetical protein
MIICMFSRTIIAAGVVESLICCVVSVFTGNHFVTVHRSTTKRLVGC